MIPTEQATRWLADVTRWTPVSMSKTVLFESEKGELVQYDDAITALLAASARHLAPEERPDAPCHIVEYTNYRGETARRVIIPIRFWWGSTEWHPEEQWMLSAWDVEKNARRDFAWQDMRPVQNGATSAAVAARHLAPGDDLVAQATAALEGVTEGPWETFIYDAGGKWTGWPLSISAVNFTDKNIVRPGGCWPYEWDAGTSQDEAVANARFIAFTRQWVPEAAARIAALTATVAELQAERDAAREALMVQGISKHLAEAEVSQLRDRLARMEGAATKIRGLIKYDLDPKSCEITASEDGEFVVYDHVSAALTDGGKHE